MASALLGNIQYNHGYSGFGNSFSARVCNDIYYDSTSKIIEFRHNMISRFLNM
jgi:hypothetical protein